MRRFRPVMAGHGLTAAYDERATPMLTRITAIAVLRRVHHLSFDDAMFVTDYARVMRYADWDGVQVCYFNDTHTYTVT